jgi:hypothetical protein
MVFFELPVSDHKFFQIVPALDERHRFIESIHLTRADEALVNRISIFNGNS